MSDQQPNSGDEITVGNIENSNVVAIGAGATAVYQQGLSVEEVATLVVKLKNEDQPTVWDGHFPYLGLTAFQESDAQFFFGRESLVDDLLERVQQANFITIAGPSGSGKSSVARAGLFHALRSNRLEKSDSWLLTTMQPKGNPIEQLALALERVTKFTRVGNVIRAEGANNPTLLQRQLEMHLSDDPRQRFVLLVDQFEETFTQTKDEATRVAFINMLTNAASVDGSRIIIILSLRADFISFCARYPELRTLMSKQFQLVGAMSPPDLAKAITLPSLKVGAEIDSDLVSRVMADMKGEPGALPLMSFALRDLFEVEKTAVGQPMDLTLPEYLDRGGIESALERHANKVFDDFSVDQKELARDVFSKLIEVGQGRADTRRTADFRELIPAGAEETAVETVVNALAQEGVRLITTSGANGGGEGTVTIAHEKLIDAWPWLRQLVDENREMIALQNQILDDAQMWTQTEDAGFLYRGGRLAQVEERLQLSNPNLDAVSQAFIQASLDQRQREIEEKEAQQKYEVEQAQKLAEEQRQRAEAEQNRSKLFRRALVIGGVLMVFLLGAIVFAVMQTGEAQKSTALAYESEATANAAEAQAQAQSIVAATSAAQAIAGEATAVFAAAAEAQALATSEAESYARATAVVQAEESAIQAQESEANALEQAAVAQSNSLATYSLAVGNDDGMRALLLAIAASRRSGTVPAFDALHTQLPFMLPELQKLSHENEVSGAIWNEDESQILVWNNDGTASMWYGPTGTFLYTLPHETAVLGAAWNKDESQILTWADSTSEETGAVTMWNGVSGEPIYTLPLETGIKEAVWSEDGSQILIWDGFGTAHVWDETKREAIHIFAHEDSINGAMWNGDESQILTWSDDGWIKFWDSVSGELLEEIFNEIPVRGAAWNEDESKLLSWDQSTSANIWDTTTYDLQTSVQHDWLLVGATWSKDGSQVLTWSEDLAARVWDATDGKLLYELIHRSEVIHAAWNTDESRILTGGMDGTVKVWDGFEGRLYHTLPHIDEINGAVWNDDGNQILSWSEDGTAKLWDSYGGELLQSLSHEDAVIGAAWNEDESQILTWSKDGTVRLWPAVNSPLPLSLVSGSIWNEDETQILTWSEQSPLATIWDITNNQLLQSLSHDRPVLGAAWNQDESQVLTWSQDGTAKVWNIVNNTLLHTLSHEVSSGNTHSDTFPVDHATWNKDESQILTWSNRGDSVRVWDSSSGELIIDLPLETQADMMIWNESGEQILTWSYGDAAQVWNGVDGELLLAIPHDDRILGATWNEDEPFLLTWDDANVANVWDTVEGTLLQTFEHESRLMGMRLNSDGDQLLIWGEDGITTMWDRVDESILSTLPHDDAVKGAVWNEDESLVLTWSADGKAKIWNLLTGQPTLVVEPDGTEVLSAQWSEDESQLLVITIGGTVRSYQINMDDLLSDACQLATRNLNWSEWQLYFPGQSYWSACPNLPPHPSVSQD